MSVVLTPFEVTADHPVPISPQGGTATVTVLSGDTLYYADTPQVSAAHNQGSVTAGNVQSFTNPAWVRSASLSTVLAQVTAPAAAVTTGSPQVQMASSYLIPSGGDDSAAMAGALTNFAPFAYPVIALGPGTFRWSAQIPAFLAATPAVVQGAGRGVTIIQLSGAAPRAFDLAHTGGETAPDGGYGLFQDITIEDLTIDCNNVGGAHHVVIGSYINGHSMTHYSLNRLRVRRVNTINVPVDKGTAATFTTAFGANADLTYSATQLGSNVGSITYVVSGLNTALSVSVTGSAVTVNVATDGTGAATSTANQVLAAVQAATTIVTVALAPGSTGAGVVAALAASNLTGAVGPVNHRLNIWLFPATTGGDSTQLSIKDVQVEDCEFYGGNHGISMGGTGASTTPVQFDELHILRCFHTCLTVGNSPGNQGHFFLGSGGSGGRITVRDSIGYYAGDIGVEIDGCGSGLVENVKIVDCTGTPFFHTVFNYPINGAQTDRLTFHKCRAEQLTDQSEISTGFLTNNLGGKSVGQVDYIDCSYYRAGAVIPSQQGAAMRFTNTIRRINIRGFKASYASGAYTSSRALTFAPVFFDSTLTNGTLPTILSIRDMEVAFNITQSAASSAAAIDLRGNVKHVIDGVVTDITTAGTSTGNIRVLAYGIGGTNTLGGSIRNLHPINGSGASNRGIFVGGTANLTVSGALLISGCDFSALGTTPVEISYSGTSNASKVRAWNNTYKTRPAPTALTGLTTAVGATIATGYDVIASFTQGTGAGVTAIDYSTNGGTTYTNLLTQASGALPAGADLTVGPLPSDALVRVTFATTQPTINLVPANP